MSKRALSRAGERLFRRRPAGTSFSGVGARLVRRRRGYYYALIALVTGMFAAEVTMHYTQSTWPPAKWAVAGTAAIATAFAIGSGLKAADLGLSRDTVGRGLKYSAGIVAATVAVIVAGVTIPSTRELFQNEAYRELGAAFVSAGVLIPLQTVIPEEMLFRGVLLGALLRRHSTAVAVSVQAVLFGLWHVVSSTGLAADNQGIDRLVGHGPLGTALGVLAAVIFTTAAGLVFGWLRVRTGSLLPSIALHWAARAAAQLSSRRLAARLASSRSAYGFSTSLPCARRVQDDASMTQLPMFPLEHALLPGEPLRLNVFEPRYRALVKDVLAADGAFGVTLIERGSEVGGGDVRTNVGTIAQVMAHQDLPDGRVLLVCEGTDRFEVVTWLEDDPYPRAEIQYWADVPPADDQEWADALARFRGPLNELHSIVDEAAAAAGRPAPGQIVPAEKDPTKYTYAASTALPFTQLDRHIVLSTPGPVERIDAMIKALDDVLPLVRARMLPLD